MSKCFLMSIAAAAIFLAAVGSGQPQQPEREFGWSLTVEPAERRKMREQPVQKVSGQAAESDEIRIETDLVLSDLLVQDKNGTPVSGLKAADFEIIESGIPQKIDVFAFGDAAIPRSIILIIDHSLSQLRHIDLSVESAKILVDSLRPNDRMAIVSDDIQLIADLTSDKDVLKAALEGLRTKCASGKFGKSYQYSALYATLNERISRNGTRNIVIFQTDGDEFPSLRRTRTTGVSSFTLEDISSTAERKGVTVYTVFTGSRFGEESRRERLERVRNAIDEQIRAFALATGKPPPTKRSKLSKEYMEQHAQRAMVDEKAVASVAERTGGIAQSLEVPEQAREVYERILSDIGRRYLIGYYPADTLEKGSREREVRITLKRKGNYRVVGGRTYVAY